MPSRTIHLTDIRRAACGLITVLLLVACLDRGAFATSLSFSQLDFNLEGAIINNSEWGAVDLTYTGDTGILYFNLNVNGTWQVQNVPVVSREGPGLEQIENFNFDLGVARGTNVSSLNFGFTLTPAVQTSIPVGSTLSLVNNELVVSFRDVGEAAPALLPAAPLVGGQAADPAKHAHKKFPNQECGLNECNPTAASNSLQFLKSQNGLTIADADITIAAIKAKLQAHPEGGVFRDHNDTRASGNPNAWWEDKKAYVESKNFPITTKQITKLSDIAAEIDRGEDVELQGDWHAAAIVSITDLAGGKFSVDVAHDTAQGMAGGTKTQTIIFNPTTGKFEGSPGFFDGSGFQYAVSESVVPEPSTVILLSLGLVCLAACRLKHYRRSRAP